MANRKIKLKVRSDRISDMYKSLGISQAELARMVHSALRGGKTTDKSNKYYVIDFNKLLLKGEMTPITVEAISDVLNCDVSYILGETDSVKGEMKTRNELINETYLSRVDIKILLNVSRSVAERIYNQADMIDDQMKFRAYPNKVRMQTVLNVQELDYELLKAQIKNADAVTSAS